MMRVRMYVVYTPTYIDSTVLSLLAARTQNIISASNAAVEIHKDTPQRHSLFRTTGHLSTIHSLRLRDPDDELPLDTASL